MASGFGCLEVACWPLVPKFAGLNLSTLSFGGEVKPLVPCRRFTACKRSLNLRGSRNLGKITTGHLYRPQFHLSLLGSLASLRTQRHVAAKVGTSKGGRKQWQTTPKNLPRMQCAKSHIGSITRLWLLPDRPLGLNTNEWMMSGCLFCWLQWNSNQQTRQPPTQNDKYQWHIDTLSSPDDGHVDARNI